MGSTTSALTPPTFSGSSTFSSSFQQVLTRAVGIASLPMQQMQNHVNDLTRQQNELSKLESSFVALDTTITVLDAATAGANSATVSDPSVVSATTTSSALPGTYSILVTSLGASSTSMSNAGAITVTDPSKQGISAATSFTLTVNGKPTTINPADTSLQSLASAINNAAAGVQATIVNVGSNTAPDYRLSVTSEQLGADTIQLNDGTDLLNTLATGSPASYQLNGSTTPVTSTSRDVTVAPGLTVSLLQQSTGSTPTTITVLKDYTGLSNALSSFATAYNAAVDALGNDRGQAGGAVTGQSIVYTLSNVLSGISQYHAGNSGAVSLSDLGLQVDQNGHLSYNAATLKAQNIGDVQGFLGSTATSGFLKSAADALTSVAQTSSGAIETEFSTLQDQINRQNKLITAQQGRITDLQNNLQQQLTKADALIATLQAQKTYYQNLFQATYGTNGTGVA